MDEKSDFSGTAAEPPVAAAAPPAQAAAGSVMNVDLRQIDCEAPLAATRSVDCYSFAALYRTAAEAAKAADDDRSAEAYRLLAAATAMSLKPEDPAEPYGPLWVMDRRRTLIPEDLRGRQSAAFAEIAPTLKNPGLRARLADIAWINNRSLAAQARLAISAYCEAVRLVAVGEATFVSEEMRASSYVGVRYLRRACQIAKASGWKPPEADDLRNRIGEVTQHAYDNGDARGFRRVARLNLDYRVTPPAEIARWAERLAASEGLYPLDARDLWIMAAEAHHAGRNTDGNNRCLKQAAESCVAMAAAPGVDCMTASSWLMTAIEDLGKIGETKERRTELESRLRAVQPAIRDEMGTFSHEFDLTKSIDQTLNALSGRMLPEAIKAFVCLDRSPDPEELRQQVLDLAEESPIATMMGMVIHDEEGKVVGKAPPLPLTGKPGDAAFQYRIARNEGLRRFLTVQGAIEPARTRIMAEHSVHIDYFRALAQMSPFVPSSRVEVYALGFARFFGGDFISALSILVPQLENSLRHVLTLLGQEPSRIKNDMTQENRTISMMLNNDRATLEKIFRPAIVFEIDNLFDFDGGPTIRHQVAHGLMADGTFDSPDAIYACWFIFRLCCLPMLPRWEGVAKVLDSL